MKHEFAFSANTSRLAAGLAALDHLGNRRQLRNIEADISLIALIVNVDTGIVGGGLAILRILDRNLSGICSYSAVASCPLSMVTPAVLATDCHALATEDSGDRST